MIRVCVCVCVCIHIYICICMYTYMICVRVWAYTEQYVSQMDIYSVFQKHASSPFFLVWGGYN